MDADMPDISWSDEDIRLWARKRRLDQFLKAFTELSGVVRPDGVDTACIRFDLSGAPVERYKMPRL